jgi:DHA2 family methylenomycin A resistance protein-like MFS transporter
LLAVVALASLAAALIEAGRRGFADGWVLAGFGLFALSACLFTLVEWRGRDPMLPLGLFTQRTFTVPSLIGLLANICFYGLIFVFSLLFQVEHGYSALRAGIAFVPMTAAILTANLYAGRLSRAIGPAPVMLAGLCGMGVACAGLFWIARSTAYAVMLPQQVLLGAGLGLLVPPMTGSVLQSAERTRSGIAAGTLTAMRQSGSLLGIALFGSLVGGRTGFFAGVHASLAISLGALALAAFLALALTRADARMRRATAGEHVPASESSISG